MQALLAEYSVSGDYQEACSCLRALDAPHYHHELTKRALLKAFEKPDKAGQLLGLICKLTDSGQISQVCLLLFASWAFSEFSYDNGGLRRPTACPSMHCCIPS